MSVSSTRLHLLPLLLSLAVAGCAGASATSSPAATTAGPSANVTAVPNASATSPTTPTPSPSLLPSAPASSSPLAGFACGYPLTLGSTRTAPALVTDVRVATGPDFDTVSVVFDGTGTPELALARVMPPFVKDPSGLPLPVAGSSFVSIRMIGASGGGYANPTGAATYTGPTTFSPNGSRLTALSQQGDFEGHFSWIAGLAGPMCYRISSLAGPARLVIDFRAP